MLTKSLNIAILIVLGCVMIGCGDSSDAQSDESVQLTPSMRTIASCVEDEGAEVVDDREQAAPLWEDAKAGDMQSAGAGGSGAIIYRGFRAAGGTGNAGKYTAYAVQRADGVATPDEILTDQPRDAIVVYVDGNDAAQREAVRQCFVE